MGTAEVCIGVLVKIHIDVGVEDIVETRIAHILLMY